MSREPMLRVDEAQERVLAAAVPLVAVETPLARASGRFLAEDVVAQLTQPPSDVSAMDGYALRFADLAGPVRIVGESAAGAPFGRAIENGEAVRIFTGAALPEGADTILVQEDADVTGDTLRLAGDGPDRPGAHVRRRGLDFSEGDSVARKGDRLTPARIGLIAAAGHGHAMTVRPPRVALIATGNELVSAGVAPGPGGIVSSNGPMLQSLAHGAGAEVEDLGIVRDDAAELAAAFARTGDFDILVTVGGASVGDHDLVKPALVAAGAEIGFWRIAMRPGKPMLAGRLADTLVLGLPGNPASAFVCATLFLLPAIRRMAGDPSPLPRMGRARLVSDLPPNGSRRAFLRARLQDGEALPFAQQDSSMLSVLAEADVLIVRPEDAPEAPAGSEVDCIFL